MTTSIFSPEDQDEYAYLNLNLEQFDKEPPDLFQGESDNPYLTLINIIKNLDYLHWTCKNILNFDLLPYQNAIMRLLFSHAFPLMIATRGGSKTTILGIYSILRCLIIPNTKVIMAGTAFRQSKQIFEVAEACWHSSPILRDIFSKHHHRYGPSHQTDNYTLHLGSSFIMAIPIGTGDKIRGLRANCLVVDEFSVNNPELFETVLSGFASVSHNPIDNVKYRATMKKKLGKGTKLKNLNTNQTIIAGTADYAWGHFKRYFDRYRTIVNSKGDPRKLAEIFPEGVPENFDWQDYAVIRLPVDKIPDGMMDDSQLARYQATMHVGTFNCEFKCVFINDSTGFFRRSLIEACTIRKELQIGSVIVKPFTPQLLGNRGVRHVMGCDPASENDNFSIVILAIHENHRRVVYCWTINKERMKERLKQNLIDDKDYYKYCANKIRDLVIKFQCETISIDTQGGGYAIIEALGDTNKDRMGELPIYSVKEGNVLWDGDERETDNLPGLHILEPVNFASAEYTTQSNTMLRKDMEDIVLLYPYFDSVSLITSSIDDDKYDRVFDSLEDCALEIEELKNELVTIVHDQSSTTKRDRFSTPEVKLPGNKKGRLRKDRYSALLMANYAARRMQRDLSVPFYQAMGGVVGVHSYKKDGPAYIAPDWFLKDAHNVGFANRGV